MLHALHVLPVMSPHSLRVNDIGDEGATALAGALKINRSLTTL